MATNIKEDNISNNQNNQLNSQNDKLEAIRQPREESQQELSEKQTSFAREYFMENDFDRLYDLLRRDPNIDIVKIYDKKQYSLIHSMVLNQSLKELQLIVEYARKFLKNKKDQSTIISDWINIQSDGGFTALHYASYRGDLSIIIYLIYNGADYYIKNSKGLNVMHIAAQGDQPISLRFFHKLGMNPLELELKKGNPLHWACFLGSENAVNYLTSYTDINLNDVDEVNIIYISFILNILFRKINTLFQNSQFVLQFFIIKINYCYFLNISIEK